ncbi:MAG: lasso peptide biosynthesis B2 protein [Proteobacteria bacterium]|nr:lasso peptide biosynthesis B2 protein [Pseudomonadota bacterium]
MCSVLADILVGYRGKTFEQILATCEPTRSAPPRITANLLRVVDDFHRWAPFAPTSGKCLLRAYMLLRLLRRRGEDATWVFGVRTWPFHAHCWLQCEDVVLDDHPERIRAFTPILRL